MKQLRYFPGIVFLMVFALFSNGNTCKSDTAATNDDPCSGTSVNTKNAQLLAAGEHFDLVGDPAGNECTATYYLQFKWWPHSRASTDVSMPPLDLENAFGAEDELVTSFSHEAPHSDLDASNDHDWVLVFSLNNAKSALPSTRYALHTVLNSLKTTDSVFISASVSYYPKK